MTVDDLHDAFEARLRAFALRLTRDPEDVDDLVQETFIRSMRHLALLEHLGPRERRSWLFTTLRNLFFDKVASNRRRSDALERLVLETGDDTSAQSVGYDDDIFDLVPEKDRRLLELKYAEGLNSTEIGHLLGIPPPTVRTRLRVALNALRKRRHRFEPYLQ